MKIVTKHRIHTPPRDIIQLVVSFHYCLHIEEQGHFLLKSHILNTVKDVYSETTA